MIAAVSELSRSLSLNSTLTVVTARLPHVATSYTATGAWLTVTFTVAVSVQRAPSTMV